MTDTERIANLKAARDAWHELNGVPICHPYAKFLEAIGEVSDALISRTLERDEAKAAMIELQHTVNVYVVDNAKFERERDTALAERDELRKRLDHAEAELRILHQEAADKS